MLLPESLKPIKETAKCYRSSVEKNFACQDTARCLKQGHYRGKDRGHSLSTWKTKSLFNRSKPFSPDPSCISYSGKTNSKIESFASNCVIQESNAGKANQSCPPKERPAS